MTQVKLNKNIGGHKTGDTIEVTEGAAANLVGSGYAETVEGSSKTGRSRGKKADSETGGGASSADSTTTAG